MISGIFITPDRTKQAGVVSYMQSHRVLIVKAGNPKNIHSPNQLKGQVVAVQAGHEVRGVPEGAEGEDRLHAAELSG